MQYYPLIIISALFNLCFGVLMEYRFPFDQNANGRLLIPRESRPRIMMMPNIFCILGVNTERSTFLFWVAYRHPSRSLAMQEKSLLSTGPLGTSDSPRWMRWLAA